MACFSQTDTLQQHVPHAMHSITRK